MGDLKKLSKQIIFITDSFPCANGGGISQTLYNLFDSYPAPMYIIARPHDAFPQGDALKATVLNYKYEHFKLLRNRLGKYINAWLQRRNFEWLEKNTITVEGMPAASSNVLVLVSTTEPIKLQLAWLLHKKLNYNVVPYFMDDWMANTQLKWDQSNIHDVAKQLLLQGQAWLMISRQLRRTLQQRYQVPEKAFITVHNPVDIQKLSASVFPVAGRIIYAGSIWPMHLDALIAVADSIKMLRAKGHAEYELVIYTSLTTWKRNMNLLEGSGVTWGGFIPYKKLQPKLQEGWLLLCTASFEESHQPYSLSSVQTKLTDYMAAGRPVLFVGPSDGASGQFVEEWDCGFTIGTNNPDDISERLLAIACMSEVLGRKARNGLVSVDKYFNKKIVQKELYSFLQAISI